MSELSDQISKSRKLSECSLNTYLSSLKKIKNILEGNKDLTTNLNYLHDFDKVMSEVIDKEKSLNSKKNKLTAILVALKSENPLKEDVLKKYNDKLKELGDQYQTKQKDQEKTDKQKKNWLEYADLIKILNNMLKEIKSNNIHKKEELSNKEFDMLQSYIILLTYTTYPLRNDFANMPVLKKEDYNKLSEEEKEKTNYLVLDGNKKIFYINDYKNRKRLGAKEFKIPSKLNKMINLWLKHNKSGFYLVKLDRKSAMSENNITKYLNKIFLKRSGKKISTSMIRHIVISHELKGTETIKDKEKREKNIENRFLHSNAVNQLYRKIK